MGKKKFNFDRTLILRICDDNLQAEIRKKMAVLEDEVAPKSSSNNPTNQHNFSRYQTGPSLTSAEGGSSKQENKILDLEGVSILPAGAGSSTSTTDETLWNFQCDGATYPARLTNLPCPVELHKTHDHAMYYKCTDVAQMLIVYADMAAMEEAESMSRYKVEGFPSYYHSGLTPPTSRIVEKRFKERVHSAIPPPVEDIKQVEKELIKLIDSLTSKDGLKQKNKKITKPAMNKVIEEVEEVVVQYEPWMDDNGRQPNGIEFDEKDDICKEHPEVWLDPSELQGNSCKETLVSENNSSMSTNVVLPDIPVLHSTEVPTKKKDSSTKKKKKAKKKIETATTHNIPVRAPSQPQNATAEDPENEIAAPEFLDEMVFNIEDLDEMPLDDLDGVELDENFLM